jgi:hypothetical protein
VTQEGVYSPDKLFDRDTITRKGTISSGAGVLARGTLLGKITATGEYVLSLAAAADGSQVPDAVLLETVDATAADVDGAIAVAGKLRDPGLTFGAGHTAAERRRGAPRQEHLPRKRDRLTWSTNGSL